MNEIKVSGCVVDRPTIFKSKNGWVICKFTLKVALDSGRAAYYLTCNLYGNEAEAFFGSVDKAGEVALQGGLMAVNGRIEMAADMWIPMDERSKRAHRAYLASRLRKTGSPQILPLGVRR